MNFKIWLESNNQNITINLDKYKNKIFLKAKELADYATSRGESLKTFKLNLNLINSSLKNFNKLNQFLFDLKNNKNLDEWKKEIYDYYSSLPISSNEKTLAFNAFRHIGDYIESLDKETTDYHKDYIEYANETIEETKKNMILIKSEIESAIARSDWGGSSIKILPNESYDYGGEISFEGTDSAHIIVGKDGLFTLFKINGINEIDDIIEGGEEDDEFFANSSEKNDYYTLIEELRMPGAGSKGKVLTLYTARPSLDRSYFQNTKTLPINLFLTNNLNHALGLADDLSTSEGKRDVYKVRINSKYLTQTLDGNIKYYMVRKDDAPIESISLY